VTGLTANQLARVDGLLDELLDLPAEARASVLDRRCPDDPVVHAEVRSLLQAAQAVGGFLSTPAMLATEPLLEDIPPGTRIGAWRILRRIGRGGMGVVYEAERVEGDFQQRVAVKLLRQESVAELPRFHIERQILASLEHPGVARLYDGGLTSDGRPYMVMEFVEGQPITEYCASRQASLDSRMQLFVQACEAVAYAHRNLIVHRDLKPANILVTPQGQVKLLDFGIAKLIDVDRPDLTQTAAAPLTPLTAAPEQLLGQPVTTATDVYALGLLLFELLTDTQPWLRAGGPIAQAVRVILDEPVPVPSRRAAESNAPPLAVRTLRGDFDAIVAKAARKEPQHRYATVDALKDDIDRALNGEPVAARSGARLYVFGRTLRRYRWVTVAVAAVLISLAAGLGTAAWQARRAQIERDAARRDAAREEAVRYQLTRLFRTAIEERGSQPATAKAMIDNSALRVLREYRSQPHLEGQIVLTLADLYGALSDQKGASTLLDSFVKQAGADTDPVALADARQKLAGNIVLEGNIERAMQLVLQAEAFWNQVPNRYTEERLEGLTIKARVLRAQGNLEAASEIENTAIAQRLAFSGRNHRETAIIYNSHGITLTAANRLDDALAAFRETTAIYKALGLDNELDAQVVLGNMGTLEVRTGHLREAEGLLKDAFEHERALAGDSAAVSAVMGLYGEVLTLTNRAAQGLPITVEAVDLATRYAGPVSPVAVRNRIFLVDAQLATGDLKGARATAASAYDTSLAQYGPTNLSTLTAQTAVAHVRFKQGDAAGARAQLLTAATQLRELGGRADAVLAQLLQYLGEIEMAAGRPAEAIAPLQEGAMLLAKFAPTGWNLAVMRERLAEALVATGRPGAAGLLTESLSVLVAELGESHPETIRAMKLLQSVRAAGTRAATQR
jgi:non-specific serine/threonine protein kinase/serine/threonine-protein kinase